mmetsp:Transcript_7917/g.24688  ORF Transcript_7917/g.24688 Transcript_7917/m.24688 type:complete len:127 (-) Transcript_7917:1233-1613(-)
MPRESTGPTGASAAAAGSSAYRCRVATHCRTTHASLAAGRERPPGVEREPRAQVLAPMPACQPCGHRYHESTGRWYRLIPLWCTQMSPAALYTARRPLLELALCLFPSTARHTAPASLVLRSTDGT